MTDDIFWLGVNVYHEARGEAHEGQIAVCQVVLNRAKKRGKSVKDTVLQPFQFSWHNGDSFPAITDYESLRSCLIIAEKALNTWTSGNTLQGADHYFADYINPPGWAAKMILVSKIGKHIFYRS